METLAYKKNISLLKRSRNFYPNHSTIAEFRPHSLTLHFHFMNAHQLFADLRTKSFGSDLRGHVGVLFHELTHWSDQISTIWGQTYLAGVFDAHYASQTNREEDFPTVIRQFDEDRRVLFPMYYHVTKKAANPHSTSYTWRISFSAGLELDSYGAMQKQRPIFFVTFSDRDTNERIARQPISVGSLLETTATWSEIRASLGVISEIEADQQLVEGVLFGKERDRILYDHKLTMYTGPVHLLAFFTGDKEPLAAYQRASLLAHVSLNVSDDLFDRLKMPEFFAPIEERASAFVSQRDRGFLFALLAASSQGVDATQPISAWLKVVLERANLPDFEQVRFLAYRQMDAFARSLPIRSRLDEVRNKVLALGCERFLSNTVINPSDSLENFDPFGDHAGVLPDIYDETGTVFPLGSNAVGSILDVDEMFLAEVDLCGFTNNLMQGCRGMTDVAQS